MKKPNQNGVGGPTHIGCSKTVGFRASVFPRGLVSRGPHSIYDTRVLCVTASNGHGIKKEYGKEKKHMLLKMFLLNFILIIPINK